MATEKKLDAQRLKPGDCMSRIQYFTVVRVGSGSVTVRDETGFEWDIGRSILEAQAYASNQFTQTKKVTRTELARVFEQDVRDSIFSVCFNKLPNQADQEKLLAEADLTTPAKRKRVAKELGVGPERILHGYIKDTHELVRDYSLPRNGGTSSPTHPLRRASRYYVVYFGREDAKRDSAQKGGVGGRSPPAKEYFKPCRACFAQGRLPVYDLESKGERLVDLRTLKWLVFQGVKYEVK